MIRFIVVISACLPTLLSAGNFARDTGLKFGNYPTGKLNSLADVPGVRVGHVTLISGDGKLIVGKGPVRTGVTVIMPGSNDPWSKKPTAGSAILNGNGESMGLSWLKEGGALDTPIVLTNTLSVAEAQLGVLKWMRQKHPEAGSLMPVVFECDDSNLNDIHGHHVRPEHVLKAIDAATDKFEEGSVGAGTGMISFDFKSDIGSSSRTLKFKIDGKEKTYTLAVLVNTNIDVDSRYLLRVGGAILSEEIPDLMPVLKTDKKASSSAVFVVATDLPLDSRQLDRISTRAFLGLARLGGVAYNGSGEFAGAFSTANLVPETHDASELLRFQTVSNPGMNSIFEAVVDASEEAVLNSLLASKTMTGRDKNTIQALPASRVKQILKKHNFR